MISKKSFILLLLCPLILFSGCCPGKAAGKGQEIVVRINNYTITREEFENEFKDSAYGRTDTPESRKDFLDSLIGRKLILQYAQKEGLDKENSFLKMIERFWEQSLLKIAVDKKTKELTQDTVVTNDEVKNSYNKSLKEGKTREPYDSVYNRIKWELAKEKETRLMSLWMAKMRNRAQIMVNKDILKEGR